MTKCTCNRDHVNDDEHRPDCGIRAMAEPTEADMAKADKLCEWLEPTCEPAGVSGAFWRASGPRGVHRGDAMVDIGAHKTAIALALAAAREQGYMSGFAACYREQKDAATRAAAESAGPTP